MHTIQKYDVKKVIMSVTKRISNVKVQAPT